MRKVVHGGARWQPKITAPGGYDSIIAADVNDAWYPPSPLVLQAIAEWSVRSNHSPDTSCRGLTEALSAKFDIDPAAIRIGAGSSDLLHHIVLSVVRPGDEVVTLEPTYAEYAHAATLADGKVRTILLDPEAGFNADVGKIADAVRQHPRLCAICNPNNPTGSAIRRNDLLRIVDAAGPETTVLIDEAYIDFCPGESLVGDVKNYPNLAVVKTFSKAYAMAGLRVGYAAIGTELRDGFDLRGRPPWAVNLLGLRAAESALIEDAYIRGRVEECITSKNQLVSQLKVPTIASSTHYFLLDLAGSVRADELIHNLESEGVFIRGLAGFSSRWQDRFVRVTVQNNEDNNRIAFLINQLLK